MRYVGMSVKSDLPGMPRVTITGTEALLNMSALTGNPVFRSFVLKGLRKVVALVELTHKRDVVLKGRKAQSRKNGPWAKRTGELSKSFHSNVDAKELSATYGTQLSRAAVVELGTQVALGGPLKSSKVGAGGKRKLLAIPTDNARVGVGGAVAPSKRDDLMFVQSRKGTKMLVKVGGFTATGKKKAAIPLKVMYILVPEVTIAPHPTLDPTAKKAQAGTKAAMAAAIAQGLEAAMGLKNKRKGGR